MVLESLPIEIYYIYKLTHVSPRRRDISDAFRKYVECLREAFEECRRSSSSSQR